MANSLTQWPMQPIPFPQGVRTNPIGWGFGASTHTTPSAPSTPHRPPLQHSFTTPQSSSFGQAATPSNEAEARHQWGAQTPTERKKRSRGSDTSSSSSINRAAKIASRPIAGSSKRRLGNERESVKDEDDSVDLGILLRTLPTTAHLPILLHLLKQDPSLQSSVLSQIPKPNLAECLFALEESRSKCRKALGVMVNVHVNGERRWTRALPEIEEHMRIANTYISYFDSTQHDTPLDPHVIYQLYHTITRDIIFLLSYVPPSSQTSSGPIKALLDLAKIMLEHWNTWLNHLSHEFNQEGGMWARPIVEQWFDGLDAVANESHAMWFALSNTSQGDSNDTYLVSQFRQAFAPFRARFYAELGWVLSRKLVE